ncbi:MAG: DUF3696 domain-containing protein [Lachnospiraceae bacterium]|nr:DUF3696 domain-containing protein [Lachnospiraceae bacterium]
MGKSSVLQSLLLLRQSYQVNQLSGLKINGKYLELGNGSDLLAEQAEEEIIEIAVEGDENARTRFSYSPDSDLLKNQFYPDGISNQSVLFGEHFFYLSAYRIEPRDLYHIAEEGELRRKEFGNTGEYALHYLNVYGKQPIVNETVVFNSVEKPDLEQQTEQWMSLIAPGILPQVFVNPGLRTAELKFSFRQGKEKTNTYKSVNVGFGITYVLPVVISLLSAGPGDLLLLENPEAHIHPAGQRWLGELIARASAGGVQILLETHSDHVLNGIRLAVKKKYLDCGKAGVFFFYKDEYKHKVICPAFDPEGNLDVWPEGFLDEWDRALLELL